MFKRALLLCLMLQCTSALAACVCPQRCKNVISVEPFSTKKEAEAFAARNHSQNIKQTDTQWVVIYEALECVSSWPTDCQCDSETYGGARSL